MSGINKKRFTCSFLGCNRSFARTEHLHRHGLNHKVGDSTCTRCAAHFRRRDLLGNHFSASLSELIIFCIVRHMKRHQQKDDEAGGPGLGYLATRKKLWKDADGNIVNTKRPTVRYTMELNQASITERIEEFAIEREAIGPTSDNVIASTLESDQSFLTLCFSEQELLYGLCIEGLGRISSCLAI